MKNHLFILAGFVLLIVLTAFPSATSADNSWNGYHWARTANPFTLKLGNNTSGLWTAMLATAASDWSQSTVLDTVVVAGRTKPKACRPTSGQVEVCSASYGNTGWLGVAQIWISGGVHITQGIVKNNDYYFGNSSYQYNNTAEMQHVICQEIGHTFGLDHQDETGISLNTCMDYYHNTSSSDTLSTHPNSHDYAELGIIYAHLDSFNTVSTATATARGANGDLNDPREWGKLARQSGRESIYERDFGGGHKLITHVTWAR